MKNKVCERCGQEFTCKSDEGVCWCFELPYIRLDKTNQYNNCLCYNCLLQLQDETSKNNNQG